MKSRIRKPFTVEIRKRRGGKAVTASRTGAISRLVGKLGAGTSGPAARS
ncbi:hypothetical protein [Rhizobium sp. R635]|nr:hypothetical protein [Rhizobium sp. R635]